MEHIETPKMIPQLAHFVEKYECAKHKEKPFTVFMKAIKISPTPQT